MVIYNRINTILMFIFFITINAEINAQIFPNPVKGNLSLTGGAESRVENFRWSIAGNKEGKDPNVFSELIYNPIKSAGFFVDGTYNIYRNFTLEANYRKLYTYKGSATDFDYADDNRVTPTTRLYLNSNMGYFTTASGNAYYNILDNYRFLVKAGAGYSITKELFYLLDDLNPDLRTTYATKWNGPGFLLVGIWNSPLHINLGGSISHHILKYNATANWNIQEEFKQPVSFIQRANGNGWNYNAFVGYQFNKHISTKVEWLYSNWKTKTGLDRLFLRSGEIPETLMNGAFKKNSGWRLSATYTF